MRFHDVQRWALCRATAAATILLGLAAAGPARAELASAPLGLSDSAILTTPNGPVAFACTFAALPGCERSAASLRRFQLLESRAGRFTAGRNAVRYVRAGVPWDAVDDGSCSPQATSPGRWGLSYIDAIERFVLAARRAGLDPLIVITDNDTSGGDHTGAPEDPRNPSYDQYRCGFAAIATTLRDYALAHGVAPPTEYETYNEPEGAQIGRACAGGLPSGYLPPLGTEQCAAWYFAAAEEVDRTQFAGRLTLAAMSADGDSVNGPGLGPVATYASYLTGTIGLWPRVWAIHPYEDVSASAAAGAPQAADTERVDAYLAGVYAGRPRPELWLTEVAVLLTDRVDHYPGLASVGCDDGQSEDRGTFGACLDGNPSAQASAATAFLALPGLGTRGGVPVTREYWHQFDVVAHHRSTWDSGLVAPGDAALRASFCVLTGMSAGAATADPACGSPAAALDPADASDG